MLSTMIRELLCNIVNSLPARRTRRNLSKIDSMEVRTLLAAGTGQSSAIPTFVHYRVDAADAPRIPAASSFARQNLNGSGLQFNFITTGTVPQQVIDGFVAAGKLWSDLFTDDIVVNVQIGYAALGSGILGQTGSTSDIFSYASVRSSLVADSKSTDDATAVSHLPVGPSLSLYTSDYSTFPSDPVVDNNNTANNNFIDTNTALARALGLRAADSTLVDAQMTFSSNFSWDFDRSNGISSNAFDFVGVAAHEIGHALGFVSGADVVDYTTGFGPSVQNLDRFAVVTGLDLFRYSTASIANGTDLDIRADTATKFFSIDGGTTRLTTFSQGSYNGDGSQASHWEDDLSIGIMDPTLAPGELPRITALDIRAFDVMGWDIRSSSGVNTAPVVNDQNLPNLNENVANGTVVGTVAASDVDVSQRLTYSIVDGNTGNAFAINSSNGQITVNNRLAVDYETNSFFQLTVQVTDNGSPIKSDTGLVTINLNNLNDLDFGDLPDSFGTNLASNGARHQTVTGLFLGAGVTNEMNGQPGSTATLDSDDGVTAPASLTPGTNAQFTVTASQAGRLDVFIDFNGNGVFESNERTTSVGGLIVNAGSNVVTVSVPSNASVGQRGARFRLSSIGGLNATGLASDGEVEDYFVTVGAAAPTYDFGDLPDTFGTLLASNGPRHQTGGGLFLGNSVSSEPDGQPDSAAFLDRDEGVTPEILGQGALAYLTVRASQAGKLDAFIDFNGNGRFDTNERVTPAGGMDLTAGSNVLRVLVPTNAVQGDRGARFRISSVGGLSALGPAADGEVEDYFFYIAPTTSDFGDLPDTFGTLLSSNGPRHNMPTRVFLGGSARSDIDGQPSALADAEAEDDGVTFPTSLTAGSTATFSVTTTVGGKLDAFIDFNGNGVFDTNERATPVGGLVLAAGANNVTVNVPGNAVSGPRGARFRLSTAGGLAATGPAVDGEVEDYFVTVAGAAPAYDFGDLPDTFGTLLASNGARHQTGGGLFLGTGVTSEADGRPSGTASLDADDGVKVPVSLSPSGLSTFTVTASKAGRLDAFIDFNGNGVFESNERMTPLGGLVVTQGVNTVSVNVPSNTVVGQRAARFRLSNDGGLGPTGPALDGEVEDYFLTVAAAGPTYDFGDLPNTFGTLLANNGARHQTGGGLFLGTGVTSEADGRPSATANLDTDDGVTAPTSLVKGTNAQFTVKASQAGKLDAFIDFNGNGVFDTNERVTPAGGLAVVAGNNTLSVSVPSNAVLGQRGARFRLSTAGGLAATGQAANGEVEDYFVAVAGPPTYDFGDLPNTFGTLLANNGARHQTGGGLFLGTGVTNETNGKPSATANLDVDDGVIAPATLAPRVTAQFTVVASKAGKLDAFIDFNSNGVFDTDERVTPAGGQALVAGQNTVNVTVPDAAVAGQLGARFRISTTGGLAATGLAANGEVEDYFVNVVRYDYGDLPNTFGTTLASNGARHQVGGGLFLGTAVTSDADGQPGTTASLDSDDGVTAPAKLVPLVNAQFKVNASQAGKLDAFIDFNGNGRFDTNERITPAGGLSLVAGVNTVNVTVPDTVVAGQRGARFRISTTGGLAATGLAADGEVEDYFVNVVRYDFGDLPNTFGTTLASNGARHQVGGGLFLGTAVTSEADGQPSETANLDSDDGVTIPSVLLPQTTTQVTVRASKAGKLDAFIDFNGNGAFDSNERVTPAGGLVLVAGLNTVSVAVPANAVVGQRAARFRLSTAGGLAAKGEALDGEVEDYFVRVAMNDFGDLPDTFGTTLAQDGARHLTGGGLYLGAGVTGELDGLPGALANRDRDDGVTFSSTLIAGLGARLNVTASQAGKLDAFIDFNGNGVFDADERVTPAGGLSLTAGINSVYVSVPETVVAGARAARFRLSSAGGLSAKGAAANGEVEDYFMNVVSPGQDTIQLLPDPESPGQQLIYINGTSGNDTISVAKTNLGFVVRMNNKVSLDLDATSRILVYGGDGHDKIALPTSIPLSAVVDGGMGNDSLWGGNGADLLLGGDGNDVIYARGGTDTVYGGLGNDTIIGDAKSHVMFGEGDNDKITGHGILVGGAGTDTLVATGSRNVLIGGEGADQLTAALDGDLLIGGTTNFDTNSVALQAILAEWSATIAVNTRIAHLTGSQSGGLNGSFFLVSDAVRPGTVHNDFAIDTITNTFAEDWLLLFSDDRRTNLAGILNHS